MNNHISIKKTKLIGLIISFGLEVFASQLIFIYIPLMLIFNESNEIFTSLIRSFSYIGPVFFGFYIGSIIDRTNKRNLGFFIAFCISLFTAIFGYFQMFNNTYLTMIYVIFSSIMTYFLSNLSVTILPIVIKSSSLSKANSILLIIENVALLITPALAAWIIKVAQPIVGFSLLSIFFLISALIYLYSLNDYKYSIVKCEHNSFHSSWRLLYKNKRLMVLIIATMGNNAFVGVFSLYIMIHAYDAGIFTVLEISYILILSGIAAILSSFFSAIAMNLLGAKKLVILCGIALAICGCLPVILHIKISYFISSFGEGFFSSWLVICVWTLRQQLVSPEILGKITGITSALFKLSMVVSIPLAGWISTHYNPSLALISASVWVLVLIIPVFIYTE